jgi:hypothetical protein
MSSTSNKPTLDSLYRMSPADVAELPAATLYDLQKQLEAAAEMLAKQKAVLFMGLDRRYGSKGTDELRRLGKAAGTAHLKDGEHDVMFVLGKKDLWDQPKLRDLWQKIDAAGEEPRVYMKQELSVAAAALYNMPENVRAEFLPALTTVPQRPTYRLAPAKESGE